MEKVRVLVRFPGLWLWPLLVLVTWSCIRENSVVDPTPVITPLVVRGYESFVLTLDVRNTTGAVMDSLDWFPEVSYLSIVVSHYASGTCTVELADRYHAVVSRDTLSDNYQIMSRRVAAAMPLRLRIDLRGFTGRLTCVAMLTPFESTELLSHFLLRDSTGAVRSEFGYGEVIDFQYSFVNRSGFNQPWTQGVTQPFGQFFVFSGRDEVLDSFAGKGWLAEGRGGVLPSGDSLLVVWRGVSPAHPLPAGRYRARVEPNFALHQYGVPAAVEQTFTVIPSTR